MRTLEICFKIKRKVIHTDQLPQRRNNEHVALNLKEKKQYVQSCTNLHSKGSRLIDAIMYIHGRKGKYICRVAVSITLKAKVYYSNAVNRVKGKIVCLQ